jgi:hypothetical protein
MLPEGQYAYDGKRFQAVLTGRLREHDYWPDNTIPPQPGGAHWVQQRSLLKWTLEVSQGARP